jgi:hypothetical protein
MNGAPRLSVGYNGEGVILYREDENGQPVLLALMDIDAAIRFAHDLSGVAGDLIRAADEYANHRDSLANLDFEPSDDAEPGE